LQKHLESSANSFYFPLYQIFLHYLTPFSYQFYSLSICLASLFKFFFMPSPQAVCANLVPYSYPALLLLKLKQVKIHLSALEKICHHYFFLNHFRTWSSHLSRGGPILFFPCAFVSFSSFILCMWPNKLSCLSITNSIGFICTYLALIL
jgi:hypothetical protein